MFPPGTGSQSWVPYRLEILVLGWNDWSQLPSNKACKLSSSNRFVHGCRGWNTYWTARGSPHAWFCSMRTNGAPTANVKDNNRVHELGHYNWRTQLFWGPWNHRWCKQKTWKWRSMDCLIPTVCCTFHVLKCINVLDDSLGYEQEVRQRRRHTRLEKRLGDWCLLAGSPKDAMEHYASCTEIAKMSGDVVWSAAALEGLAESKVGFSCEVSSRLPMKYKWKHTRWNKPILMYISWIMIIASRELHVVLHPFVWC